MRSSTTRYALSERHISGFQLKLTQGHLNINRKIMDPIRTHIWLVIEAVIKISWLSCKRPVNGNRLIRTSWNYEHESLNSNTSSRELPTYLSGSRWVRTSGVIWRSARCDISWQNAEKWLPNGSYLCDWYDKWLFGDWYRLMVHRCALNHALRIAAFASSLAILERIFLTQCLFHSSELIWSILIEYWTALDNSL